MAPTLQCGRFELSLERPLVMGVLNVTPDSFAEESPGTCARRAIRRAHEMREQGADLIDIGGESTRPGARALDEGEECRRILPVLAALRDLGLPLSVDTRHPATMRAALDAGADMINDVTGFRGPGAIGAVAASACALCVMHMQGSPATMQDNPHYVDLASEIREFLDGQCRALEEAGVARRRIVVDPGFGFGKTQAQNYELMRRLDEACSPEYPWLIGVSRKSMIGHVTGRGPLERLAGSIAAALAGVARGAAIVRVHDVAATRDALRVWQAVEKGLDHV